MDDELLRIAFETHKASAPLSESGRPMLTRRIVIVLADMADASPKAMVARLERLGLAPAGAWDWFRMNGGITPAQIAIVRSERRAT